MVSGGEDELIDVRESAKRCGRNMETVRRWIWSGKLPARKLGNQLFIKRSDLVDFCRETVLLEYSAEPAARTTPEHDADLTEKLKKLRQQLHKDASSDFYVAGDTRKAQTIRGIETKGGKNKMTRQYISKIKPDFLERARAVRNEVFARTHKVFDAETMIREVREERDEETK